MKVKPLKTEFKTNKFMYKLIKRIGDYALVRAFKLVKGVEEHRGWEIHHIRIIPIPPAWRKKKGYMGFVMYQSYASNEAFGQYGWSYDKLSTVYEDYPQFKGVEIE